MNSKKTNLLTSLNPAVPRAWLLILAGLMWMAVGLMLSRFAYNWLSILPQTAAWPPALLGVALAVVIYRFGFGNIARKNAQRIHALTEKVCLFAFQEWKSYLIIVVMMTTGILLRSSSIPRQWLAVLYVAIGGGLFLSSFHYYTQFYSTLKKQ